MEPLLAQPFSLVDEMADMVWLRPVAGHRWIVEGGSEETSGDDVFTREAGLLSLCTMLERF